MNYEEILLNIRLAILRQAQIDYRQDTLNILKYKDKIKKLKAKSKSKETKKKIIELNSLLNRAENNKRYTIYWWGREKSNYEMLPYELILNRFYEIEKQAKEDYKKGIKRKGSYKV